MSILLFTLRAIRKGFVIIVNEKGIINTKKGGSMKLLWVVFIVLVVIFGIAMVLAWLAHGDENDHYHD